MQTELKNGAIYDTYRTCLMPKADFKPITNHYLRHSEILSQVNKHANKQVAIYKDECQSSNPSPW